MITYSRLGKKGNLGNQMFQIASTIGLSIKHNHKFVFPYWSYAKYFNFKLPQDSVMDFERIHEKSFNYHNWNIEKGNYDIFGYLQSEKYFDKNLTKKVFTFKDEFIEEIKRKNNLTGHSQNILISVRRGDYVHHPWFYQLSYKFYLGALLKHFPDWKDRNLIFTSDDINYCKFHFSFLPNSYFLENMSPIEQLAFGSCCKDFIISNSTFSWWMAWLGEKKDSKVITPLNYFRGKHGSKTDEQDYFPKRWIKFNHHNFNLPNKYYMLYLKGECYAYHHALIYYLHKVKLKSIKMIKQ